MGNFIVITVRYTSNLYTIYVLAKLMYFLSSNVHENDEKVVIPAPLALSPEILTLWKLGINLFFLSLFFIQHSAMASDSMKEIFQILNLKEMHRSIYNLSSAAVLNMLIQNWERITYYPIWNYDTLQNNKIWLAVTSLHIIAWIKFICQCFVMGIMKLPEIEQNSKNITSQKRTSLRKKSAGFPKRIAYVAHPSFTSFLVILWFHPVMSLDRLMMAVFLTAYMVVMWSIDEEDFRYHCEIIERERRHI